MLHGTQWQSYANMNIFFSLSALLAIREIGRMGQSLPESVLDFGNRKSTHRVFIFATLIIRPFAFLSADSPICAFIRSIRTWGGVGVGMERIINLDLGQKQIACNSFSPYKDIRWALFMIMRGRVCLCVVSYLWRCWPISICKNCRSFFFESLRTGEGVKIYVFYFSGVSAGLYNW